MSLKGKAAVVTGSATGIGQGIAVALARAGVKVAVTWNRDPADGTMDLIKKAGGEAILVKTDVSSRESIRDLMMQTKDAFGRIDILVNNAAWQPNKLLFEYTEEDFDKVMAINVKGYWRCIQEVLPSMKKQEHGRIINIASIHAKRPTGFDAIYGTSKGGVKMLTREAALALGPYGITVNTLAPGAVALQPRETKPAIFKTTALNVPEFNNFPPGGFLSGRVGYPYDIAYCVLFLADEQSQYITGSMLRADGGAMMY
ncbi:beta-ketoacyl-ACP reductase [Spirochaetia bacterium]|nr:beta-ketoacyl-ACP reductase [Spirochaetia bacterium]